MFEHLENPTVHICSMGCVENQLDGVRMERFFAANGWKLSTDASEADLVLVNSCGYTESLEKSSLEAVEKLKIDLKPGARIHLVGCLPAINAEAVGENDGLKVIPRNLRVLNDLIGAKIPIEEVEANALPPDENRVDKFRSAMITIKRGMELIDKAAPFKLPRGLRQFGSIYDDRAYYIKISVGCLGRCSFCAVRRAKGKLMSRDPERILQDFDAGLKSGSRDIVLSADESGAYGRDRGTTLAELLREMLKRSGDYQILLRNLDPEWLIKDLDNLIPLFQTGRFPYIVSPIQTGSELILKLMDRGYTCQSAAEAFARLRAEVPDLILRTHLIVGFPGETDALFQETLDYARRLKIDHFKVHEFSARPHTRAAKLPDPVPSGVIKSRARRLRRLGLEIFARSFFS
ncbi:radical SAM protein [bacterium]|nr:radical SAM protein [bacterium]MBU1652300.1 radical SAM protein [bacterium]